MGLRTDAQRLIGTLESVLAGLAGFRGSPIQVDYTGHLHGKLRPLVEELRALVDDRADRSVVLSTMAEIKQVMDQVGGAASKGEMAICKEGVLDTFWDLSTIFQERRYRNESL